MLERAKGAVAGVKGVMWFEMIYFYLLCFSVSCHIDTH